MKHTEKQRRKLIKSTLIGGGVIGAANWSKPIVNAVTMPAHAQTTDTTGSAGTGGKALRPDQINSDKIDYFA